MKNEDSRESAVISVQAYNPDGSQVSGTKDKELKGGEVTDLYVHSTQQLLVKEVRQ